MIIGYKNQKSYNRWYVNGYFTYQWL